MVPALPAGARLRPAGARPLHASLGPMGATQSALIIEIPEAEPVVSQWRSRLSSVATLGVPAHVTVLYPFLAPDLIDDAVLDGVAAVAAAVDQFEYRFSTTGWFGDEVLHLVPDDPRPFAELTDALAAAFPEHPPYGGEIREPVPHLTVADAADVEEMRRAESAIRENPPVEGRAHRLTLIGEDPARHWSPIGWFPLGGEGGFDGA